MDSEPIFNLFRDRKLVKPHKKAELKWKGDPTTKEQYLLIDYDGELVSAGFRARISVQPNSWYRIKIRSKLLLGDMAFVYCDSIRPNRRLVERDHLITHELGNYEIGFQSLSSEIYLGLLFYNSHQDYRIRVDELAIFPSTKEMTQEGTQTEDPIAKKALEVAKSEIIRHRELDRELEDIIKRNSAILSDMIKVSPSPPTISNPGTPQSMELHTNNSKEIGTLINKHITTISDTGKKDGDHYEIKGGETPIETPREGTEKGVTGICTGTGGETGGKATGAGGAAGTGRETGGETGGKATGTRGETGQAKQLGNSNQIAFMGNLLRQKQIDEGGAQYLQFILEQTAIVKFDHRIQKWEGRFVPLPNFPNDRITAETEEECKILLRELLKLKMVRG